MIGDADAAVEQLRLHNMVLAAYAAKHLQDDIRNGMDIKLGDLLILLNAVAPYLATNPA